MPYFGLGLFRSGSGSGTTNAIKWAYEAGYRLFDTAQFYDNEIETGEAIRKIDIDRSEVFVTSKVWTSNFGYDKTIKSVDESLAKFQLAYLDMFLLHYPVPEKRLDSWRALEDLHKEGKIRTIGVSNFTIMHLDELITNCDIVPAVNQVEFHPWLYQHELLEKCKRENILLQAYSPLVKGQKLGDRSVQEIAAKYDKSNAQILIRWAVELGISVIPKSSNKLRIEENSSVFDFQLETEDVKTLNNLDIHYHCSWDPCNEK